MKFAREMKAEAEALGFENIAIERSGKHQRLTAAIHGRPVQYFFATTPSDWRARRNNFADLRRIAKGQNQC
jgi:hypothetical protein